MKSEDQPVRIASYLMFWLIDFVFFFFFVFILHKYFSRKKLALINLNAAFPEEICCNVSYKNLFQKVEITHVSRL